VNDLIVEIVKDLFYVPVRHILICFGWENPKQISLIILFLFLFFWKLYKIYFPRVRNFLSVRWSTKYLAKVWTATQIKLYTQYFVRPRISKISPSKLLEGEIKISTDFTKDAIKHFTDKVFKENDDQKFYMILGESGVGKSAFIINLLVSFNRNYKNIFNNRHIEAIDLSHTNPNLLITEIKNRVNTKNTILLLDAFDEDDKARENWRNRLDELGRLTQNFAKVVFTSRLQFFLSEDNEPREIGIKVSGPEKRFHKVITFYLYPFNEKQINKFLDYKYGIYPLFRNLKKKRKAQKITESSTKLMERPFLLQHIDDLIQENDYVYEYQIYNRLISEWIKRESQYEIESERDSYIESLNFFSLKLAKNMYEKSHERNGFHISTEEIKQLCEENKINISLLDARSRSLLSRGSYFYKFVHKSIFEFLLAKESLNSKVFRNLLKLNNLSDADKYYRQLSKVDIVMKYLKNEKIKIYIDYNNMNTICLTNLEYEKFVNKLEKQQFASGIDEMNIQNIFIKDSGKYDWSKLKNITSLKEISFYNNDVKKSININELKKHLPYIKTSTDRYNYDL